MLLERAKYPDCKTPLPSRAGFGRFVLHGVETTSRTHPSTLLTVTVMRRSRANQANLDAGSAPAFTSPLWAGHL